MTMEEMARIIGVSRITLSKVINGKKGVAPETRERIQKYIQEYNFEPNSHARSLVGKKEPIIGFFTTYSRDASGSSYVTSHFASEVMNLIVDEAQKQGYKTLVDITERDAFGDIELYLSSGLIMGGILLGYSTGREELDRLSQKGLPLVLINQEADTVQPNISTVNMNDEIWAFEAIEKMVRLNHRKILYIGCSRSRLPAIRRGQGVRHAYEKYRDQIIWFEEHDGDFNEMKAYEIVKRIFTGSGEKPTGIFAANDLMAIGAINALKDLNVKIPEKVSVIGFDDVALARYLTPALTTVHCDFKEVADKSVTLLVDCIEGRKKKEHLEIDLDFVERESLGPCP